MQRLITFESKASSTGMHNVSKMSMPMSDEEALERCRLFMLHQQTNECRISRVVWQPGDELDLLAANLVGRPRRGTSVAYVVLEEAENHLASIEGVYAKKPKHHHSGLLLRCYFNGRLPKRDTEWQTKQTWSSI